MFEGMKMEFVEDQKQRRDQVRDSYSYRDDQAQPLSLLYTVASYS